MIRSKNAIFTFSKKTSSLLVSPTPSTSRKLSKCKSLKHFFTKRKLFELLKYYRLENIFMKTNCFMNLPLPNISQMQLSFIEIDTSGTHFLRKVQCWCFSRTVFL